MKTLQDMTQKMRGQRELEAIEKTQSRRDFTAGQLLDFGAATSRLFILRPKASEAQG